MFRSPTEMLLVAGMAAVLLVRTRDEERLLGEVFGEEYCNCQRHTRRLLPWLY